MGSSSSEDGRCDNEGDEWGLSFHVNSLQAACRPAARRRGERDIVACARKSCCFVCSVRTGECPFREFARCMRAAPLDARGQSPSSLLMRASKIETVAFAAAVAARPARWRVSGEFDTISRSETEPP